MPWIEAGGMRVEVGLWKIKQTIGTKDISILLRSISIKLFSCPAQRIAGVFDIERILMVKTIQKILKNAPEELQVAPQHRSITSSKPYLP